MDNTVSLPFAFACLLPTVSDIDEPLERLRAQMVIPSSRVYHTETHIHAVLQCVFDWTRGAPSASLLAAALYHDAVYDATEQDNEIRSADFCRTELARVGVPASVTDVAARLIMATAHHVPAPDAPDEILLLDADLFTLGATPTEYAQYVDAVRAEYAHVPDSAWQIGRGRVLESFLARPRVYHGTWQGRDERENAARRNLQAERDRAVAFF